MAETIRAAIRELMEQTMRTMDALLEASDRELTMSSSHACAQGKDVWTLVTNDIDHEKIHTGQVLEGRYESRNTASPMERLLAEWLAGRAVHWRCPVSRPPSPLQQAPERTRPDCRTTHI